MDIRINQTFDEILAAYSKPEFEGMAEMLTANLNQGKSFPVGSDFSLPLRPIFLTIDQYRAIHEASFYLGSAVRKIAKALIREGLLANEVSLNDSERTLVEIDPLYDSIFTTAAWSVLLKDGKPKFTGFFPDQSYRIALNDMLAAAYMGWQPMARMQTQYDMDNVQSGMRLFQEVLGAYEGYKQKKHILTVEKKPVILIADWLEEHGASCAERLVAYGKAQGYDVLIADPRSLDFRGNALFASGLAVDAVWRVFPSHDMMTRKNECEALLEAYKERKVCMVDSPRSVYLEKPSLLSVLTDEKFERVFSRYEREAIQTFIPWTKRFEESFARYNGKKVDLPEFVHENKDVLILMSNDRYRKDESYVGGNLSESEWARKLEDALKDEGGCWIVQENAGSMNDLFPVLRNGNMSFESYRIEILPHMVGTDVGAFSARLSKSGGLDKKENEVPLPVFISSKKQVASKVLS